MRVRKVGLLMLIAVLLVVVTACSGSKTSESTVKPSEKPTTAPTTATEASASPDQAAQGSELDHSKPLKLTVF